VLKANQFFISFVALPFLKKEHFIGAPIKKEHFIRGAFDPLNWGSLSFFLFHWGPPVKEEGAEKKELFFALLHSPIPPPIPPLRGGIGGMGSFKKNFFI